MINEPTAKLICRKCGGPHFTIKCGKESDKINTETKIDIESNKESETKIDLETKKNNYKPRREKHYSKTSRVKLSELPKDMTEEELMELTSDWGHIVRIKVINYYENSVAYIDFGFENESKYFIEAIDKTPFDSLLLSACIVDSY